MFFCFLSSVRFVLCWFRCCFRVAVASTSRRCEYPRTTWKVWLAARWPGPVMRTRITVPRRSLENPPAEWIRCMTPIENGGFFRCHVNFPGCRCFASCFFGRTVASSQGSWKRSPTLVQKKMKPNLMGLFQTRCENEMCYILLHNKKYNVKTLVHSAVWILTSRKPPLQHQLTWFRML